VSAALTPTERVRADLSERMSTFPLVTGAPVLLMKAWVLPHLTEAQQHERALIETRMRAGNLRGLPTCFGDLA
jgi:hypothetical protein